MHTVPQRRASAVFITHAHAQRGWGEVTLTPEMLDASGDDGGLAVFRRRRRRRRKALLQVPFGRVGGRLGSFQL